MAHFAEIKSDNNEVIRVVVINNEDVNNNGGDLSIAAENWVKNNIIQDPIILKENNNTYPQTYWKQTSYNNNFRKRYAGVEFTYDSSLDAFIPPRKHNSWVFNSDRLEWNAPIKAPSHEQKKYGNPEEENIYRIQWEEQNLRWIGFDNVNNKFIWIPSSENWVSST